MIKTAENLKLDKNKVKSKMGFRAYNSKGVDKNGAKCNMGFGRTTKIYQRLRLTRDFGWPSLEIATITRRRIGENDKGQRTFPTRFHSIQRVARDTRVKS